jgi:hypothetical protein
MGFKKAGGKKKKTAKKGQGKKGRKDSWAFDGGQYTEEPSVKNDEELPTANRTQRRTQDRDERMRRGRMKIEERKQKKHTDQRLAKKIRFSDVLADVISESDGIDDDVQQEVKKQKYVRTKSSRSVLDRLQEFVSKAISAPVASTDVARETKRDSSVKKGKEEKSRLSTIDEGGASESSLREVDEEEEEEEDLLQDSDGDGNGDGQAGSDAESVLSDGKRDDAPDAFEWMYDSRSAGLPDTVNDVSSSGSSSGGMKQLLEFNGLQLYGSLNEGVGSPKPISSLGGIQGLPKMWRGQRSQRLTGQPFLRNLLPFLSSYADALIEGRDHLNDDELLTSVMTHVCIHTVRAR